LKKKGREAQAQSQNSMVHPAVLIYSFQISTENSAPVLSCCIFAAFPEPLFLFATMPLYTSERPAHEMGQAIQDYS
jgi:hypothetical protein